MQFEASRLEGLEHRTDAQSAPEVFFTPIITPESLVAAYHALGRKPEGKTAIKVHSGESEKSNNLNPSLVKDLVQEIGGTLVECATAYDGNRETPEKSLATFKKHGYADLAPIQIMDMGGEIEIPVAKHRHIAYDIVGKHIDDYDSIFVLSHFKGHPMGGFGGALKNVSIGIASSNGKRWIHSAGVTKDKWVETPQDAFLESMAEADEAVIGHMHGKMMYLNVMNRLSVDCDCLAPRRNRTCMTSACCPRSTRWHSTRHASTSSTPPLTERPSPNASPRSTANTSSNTPRNLASVRARTV